MKDRAKQGFTFAKEFDEFIDFLRIVGPKPDLSFSLDRIDPHDREYAPGKVRWADKTTQTRNRLCTIVFRHPQVPRDFYAPEVAEMVGVKENTIRKRKREGWSDQEIFLGRRLPASATDCAASVPPKDTRDQEARELAQAFAIEAEADNSDFVAEIVTSRRVGQAKAYIRARGDIARPVMMHAVANWIAFTKKAEAEAGAYNSPLHPRFNYFFRYENIAIAMWRRAGGTTDITKLSFSDPKAAPAENQVQSPPKPWELHPDDPGYEENSDDIDASYNAILSAEIDRSDQPVGSVHSLPSEMNLSQTSQIKVGASPCLTQPLVQSVAPKDSLPKSKSEMLAIWND